MPDLILCPEAGGSHDPASAAALPGDVPRGRSSVRGHMSLNFTCKRSGLGTACAESHTSSSNCRRSRAEPLRCGLSGSGRAST